ncbi:MAG: PIG-L family deacetylase [Muribaculum sp.]|nr:PIG-L family deacetylase [Muribaculaceae bacterium]MCM1081303.1 PIG-L family deacetylase [Muribaculum sp.]
MNLHLSDKIKLYPKFDGVLPDDKSLWTDKLVLSAVIWLSRKLNKPILKLTSRDYKDAELEELALYNGSAYDLNIKVFDALQRTITGWPGGKPGTGNFSRPARELPYPKRILIFSPHPDDDVISMGGTIARLVKQGHEVYIAYQTSGNIAVGDEEVARFMHFINGFNQLFGDETDLQPESVIPSMYRKVKQFLKEKQPGQLYTKDILAIKGLIRRGEARTACTYNGIPLNRVFFLDLPFYESGKIEKLPMTEVDVNIVSDLLRKIEPHQIYVAADMGDPHGTHRKCTDAVLAAIDEAKQKGEKWLDECRIWMYRGAWDEWAIEDIEMCVPMSPEELRQKRMAILKHSSQMESAPFLGNDERLFWQRAEDRNRATAALYESLGLASYEAMEAFFRYQP